MLPKISIITPSYNQGMFLEETILSILNQNYPNLEFIIIDGGSNDQTIEIIEGYKHVLKYWESNKDNGQAHAINKGFKKSTGDIITFCSSDDIYLPNTLLYIGEKWEKWKNFGAFSGSFIYMDGNSNFIGQKRKPMMLKNGPTDLTIGEFGNYRLHQVSTFYNKNAIDNVGRYVDEKYNYVFDRELLYRIVKSYPIYMDEKLLGAFRVHQDSKSVSKIIPFSKEFSSLYLSRKSGELCDDFIRKKKSKYYLYRGYIKYSIQQKKISYSIIFLIMALRFYPISIFTLSYWVKWKHLVTKMLK